MQVSLNSSVCSGRYWSVAKLYKNKFPDLKMSEKINNSQQKCLVKCEEILLIVQVLKKNLIVFRARGKQIDGLRVMKKYN
jgi:flagellar biogenesis protein FliO